MKATTATRLDEGRRASASGASGVDGGGGDVRLKLRSEKGGRDTTRSEVPGMHGNNNVFFKGINVDSKPKICSKQNPNTAYIRTSHQLRL